jgi:hypothetical protein
MEHNKPTFKLYVPSRIETINLAIVGLVTLALACFAAMPLSNSATRNTFVIMIQASCIAGIVLLLYKYKLKHEGANL